MTVKKATFSAEIDVLSPSLLVAGPNGLIQNFNQEQVVSSQESFSVLFCVCFLCCVFQSFKSISHPNGLVMSGVIGLTTSHDSVVLVYDLSCFGLQQTSADTKTNGTNCANVAHMHGIA